MSGQKASGNGTQAPVKKDGYAAGSVPKIIVGSKDGVLPDRPYSGPNVEKPNRGLPA